MNHSEIEIPIIDGWTKIRVTVGDSEMFLPSDEILDRLIRFPTYRYNDIYNLNKFRIKPQVFDRDSQLLLQERSNQIIDYLLKCPLTDYESRIVQWCQENGRNSTSVLFQKKIVDYCEFILPGLNPNVDKDSMIEAVARKAWNPSDPDFRARYKNVNWVYWDKRKRDEKALIDRFPEYGCANKTISWIAKKISDEFILDEYKRINGERKWFKNHKNNLFGKKGSLRKFKDTLPLELPNGTLTQCLFCYRFYLQTVGGGGKKSSLSRCCNLDECKARNHEWENIFPLSFELNCADLTSYGLTQSDLLLLDAKRDEDRVYFNIKQADVPLSGF